MAESYMELRSLTEEQLVEKYDKEAEHVVVATGHYLDELHRRDQTRLANAMLRYTKWITVMTLIVTLATIVNVVLAFFY